MKQQRKQKGKGWRRAGLLTRLSICCGILCLSLLALLQAPACAAHAAPKQAQAATSATAKRQGSHRAGNTPGPGQSNGLICGQNVALNNIQDCITVDAPYNGGAYQINDQKVYNPVAPKSTLYFITPLDATANNAIVKSAWTTALAIVDVFVALVLMLNGLKIIVTGTVFRYADAVESIPSVLLALIAAHVSFVFIGFFLGLNNTLSGDLYTWVNSNTEMQKLAIANDSDTKEFTQEIVLPGCENATFGCNKNGISGIDDPRLPKNPPVSADSQGRVCVKTAVELEHGGRTVIPGHYTLHWSCASMLLTPTDLNFTNVDLGSIMLNWGNIIPILVQILGVMVIGQIIIRTFFLNLYIALAPIGIGCWALPGKAGQGVTRLWLTGFLSTVLIQFLQVVALIVISVLANIFMAVFSQPLEGVISIDLFKSVIQITMLWLIIQIPGLFNSAPMRTLVEAGQAATQVVTASVGAQIAIVQAGIQVGSTGLETLVNALTFFRE